MAAAAALRLYIITQRDDGSEQEIVKISTEGHHSNLMKVENHKCICQIKVILLITHQTPNKSHPTHNTPDFCTRGAW